MAQKHPLTEGKKNIIAAPLQEYDIQSAEDIQEALKDLLGGMIQSIMEAHTCIRMGPRDLRQKGPAS